MKRKVEKIHEIKIEVLKQIKIHNFIDSNNIFLTFFNKQKMKILWTAHLLAICSTFRCIFANDIENQPFQQEKISFPELNSEAIDISTLKPHYEATTQSPTESPTMIPSTQWNDPIHITATFSAFKTPLILFTEPETEYIENAVEYFSRIDSSTVETTPPKATFLSQETVQSRITFLRTANPLLMSSEDLHDDFNVIFIVDVLTFDSFETITHLLSTSVQENKWSPYFISLGIFLNSAQTPLLEISNVTFHLSNGTTSSPTQTPTLIPNHGKSTDNSLRYLYIIILSAAFMSCWLNCKRKKPKKSSIRT